LRIKIKIKNAAHKNYETVKANKSVSKFKLEMPAANKPDRARRPSRRELLRQGKTFELNLDWKESHCFQRFVDFLDDGQYEIYRQEKRIGSSTHKLFPINQNLFN
jgi:hypothetical protein